MKEEYISRTFLKTGTGLFVLSRTVSHGHWASSVKFRKININNKDILEIQSYRSAGLNRDSCKISWAVLNKNNSTIFLRCIFLRLLKEVATKILIVSFERDSKTIYRRSLLRNLICALFRDIFWLEILSRPLSQIFVDMHETSQVGSRNFIFLKNND